MDKIIANNIDESKTNYFVATQPAATLGISAGELAIYIGVNVKAINNQRCISALQQLRDALREANYSDGAAVINFAHVTPPDGKQGVTIGNAAAIPVLTENEVVIAYRGDFHPEGNSQIFIGHINRLIETFQEKVLKFT